MIVTICVIAYNEEKTLPRLLFDIIAQNYEPSNIEVVLIDSMSTDATYSLMQKFADENPQFRDVKIEKNEKVKLAPGWNKAISLASGDAIVRVDAHARIPVDFIRQNVVCLESGEMVSGGPRPSIPEEDTLWQQTLLLAEASMFGSGISDFRREGKKKYVKSLFHGAYRKEVFEKVGLFNEILGRTEDNEMNYRVRKAGYRLCFNPEIRSYQNVRSSLRKMMKQKSANGYWVALTLKECPQCLSVYYFVPLAFVLAIMATTFFAVQGFPLLSKLMWGIYGLATIVISVTTVWHKPKHLYQLFLPVLFFLLHISYGIGSLAGMMYLPFWKKGCSESEVTYGKPKK